MSRGLGTLQREILATLKADQYRFWRSPDAPRDVHSLSDCRWHLAKMRGQKHGNTPATRSFSATFSRAARGLIEAGFLEVVNEIGRGQVRLKRKSKR
jgi:hypothetical protein